MDDRMKLLSSSLLYQIRSFFDNPQSNNLYSEDASAFPGQSSVQTVTEPPQPHDKSVCVRSRERLVCEGGTGAQASGLAQAQGSDNKSLSKSKLAQSINSYSEDASAFLGQSGAQTVPEPPQPQDKIREHEEP